MNRPASSSWIGFVLLALSFVIGLGLVACMKVGDGVGVNAEGMLVAPVIVPIDSCTLPSPPARCVNPPIDSCTLTPKPASCPSEGPSFAADIAPLLSTNCESCHSPTGTAFSFTKLSLTKADAYALLVNVESVEMATLKKPMKRVLPGNPDSSFLYLKVSMKTPPGGGQRMPLNAAALAADKIELIRSWIAAGAKP
jgi:hypothetical protein